MSLRMNLYGWSLDTFTSALGSKNAPLLAAASTKACEILTSEPQQSQAKAWLQTLVHSGFPLQQDRPPAAVPEDGGLITVQMEGEVHVFAIHALIRALAPEEYLDLAAESSNWTHGAVTNLAQDLSACHFTKSKSCGIPYFGWMERLTGGSPLFGDGFRTNWSYYSYFKHQELAEFSAVLRNGATFERQLPPQMPAELAKSMRTQVSGDGKEFIGELTGWFERIQQAGQDAFIVWW